MLSLFEILTQISIKWKWTLGKNNGFNIFFVFSGCEQNVTSFVNWSKSRICNSVVKGWRTRTMSAYWEYSSQLSSCCTISRECWNDILYNKSMPISHWVLFFRFWQVSFYSTHKCLFYLYSMHNSMFLKFIFTNIGINSE